MTQTTLDLAQLWFVGDPHSDFRDINRLAVERKPATVVFLGDLELPAPFEQVVAPMLDLGITVRFIHGNHDADREDLWERIEAAAAFNLHGKVEDIGGLKIAGLGGVFTDKVWRPPGPARHASYEAFKDSLIPHWWTEAERQENAPLVATQLLVQRASIFPNTYDDLVNQAADVLVTHEAPQMHPHGFTAIGELAELLGARLAFHGHHHQTTQYPHTEGECLWTSVDTRQIVDAAGRAVAAR